VMVAVQVKRLLPAEELDINADVTFNVGRGRGLQARAAQQASRQCQKHAGSCSAGGIEHFVQSRHACACCHVAAAYELPVQQCCCSRAQAYTAVSTVSTRHHTQAALLMTRCLSQAAAAAAAVGRICREAEHIRYNAAGNTSRVCQST
jgi:hypothetical protein